MKARVKETGEIVTLDSRCNVTEVVKGGHPRMWTLAELELEQAPDYWTRLEHQYAGMFMKSFLDNFDGTTTTDELADSAIDIAHALVEKYKENEKAMH